MKVERVGLNFLSAIFFGVAAANGQTPHPLQVRPAVELRMETSESQDYQLFSSQDLQTWQPYGLTLSGTGASRSIFVPTDGAGSKFFKAEKFPSSITKWIPGLTSLNFDTAITSTQGGDLVISGVRVASRDHDENDYLKIKYRLDLATQSLLVEGVEVFPDVGPTTQSPFFILRDAPANFTLTNGGTTIPSDTSTTVSVPDGGVNLSANLQTGQVLNFVVTTNSGTAKVSVINPSGVVGSSSILPANFGAHMGRYGGIAVGQYQIRIEPFSSGPTTVQVKYINANRRAATVLTHGSTLNTSTLAYLGDYSRHKISLTSGQRFSLTGNWISGVAITIFDSAGKFVTGRTATTTSTLAFDAPSSGEYFIVFYSTDIQVHSFTGTVSVTTP